MERRTSWFRDRFQPQSPRPQHHDPPTQPNQPMPDPNHPTPPNKTLFQTFEWHTPSTPPPPHETHSPTSHYARLNHLIPSLSALGITALWLPPGCKANNPQGNGYDAYDLWDLGEFDQKYARSTRWGSREELHDLLSTAASQPQEVDVIWDAVLNHKTAGDGKEEVWAVEVEGSDRRVETCEARKIEAWLRYDFPGRGREGMKYSGLQWRGEHFNGTDWDDRGGRNAIFKIVDDPGTYPKPVGGWQKRLFGRKGVARPGKGWAEDVDDMHGNYDYLMFSNVDYKHPEVRKDVINWGRWMVEDVGVHGFRLDAVQHFSYAFSKEWINNIRQASQSKAGKDGFIVGEIWTNEVRRILSWLDVVGQGVHAYDSPLVYNFSRISEDVRTGSRNADLRTILRDSLLQCRPHSAVTLVTNHDTQPGQASYTPMMAKLKPLWYAFVLLRQEGYPCVFWGDLYGTKGPEAEPPACLAEDGHSLLADLVLARTVFAYGAQIDYFDAASCIGWTRAGTHDRPGCAAIMSIQAAKKGGEASYTQKSMKVGNPGEIWVDILGSRDQRAEVEIDGKGEGVFPCRGGFVAVFVRKDVEQVGRFPVGFDVNVYNE